jgi:UPF0716 protein FxsA
MFPKLLLLFILVPVTEIYLFFTVGGKIGVPTTIGIVLLTAFIGANLARRQGQLTMQKFKHATGEGRVPHEEVMDGIMIIIAGALLLTPGFLTDAIGFSLLVPSIRTMVRKYATERLKNNIKIVGVSPSSPSPAPENESPPERSKSPRSKGKIIDAEIIDK